jgi:protein TonB
VASLLRFPLLIVVQVAALGLTACDDRPTPVRKMQTVKLLPDAPPPPPPKPEEKKPEAPKEEKPQQQLVVNKPLDAPPPQPQALRSDETAGDGPGGGLVAGSVSQDYSDQKIGQGTAIGGGADTGGNRLAMNSFANAATRNLNEFLARDKDVRRLDYKVGVDLWLTPSGSLQRAELVGSTGDPATDQALRAALARFPGTPTPPPERMLQPIRLLLTNRLMG